MTRILAVLLVAVCTALPVSAAEDALTDLQISAGRLGLMMSEGHDLLPLLAVPQPPPLPGTSGPNKGEIFDTLVLAVLDYNVLSFQACHTGAVGPELCHGLYLPPWLAKQTDNFSDAQLDQMISDSADRLMPLWHALCDRARTAHAPEPVCPME